MSVSQETAPPGAHRVNGLGQGNQQWQLGGAGREPPDLLISTPEP